MTTDARRSARKIVNAENLEDLEDDIVNAIEAFFAAPGSIVHPVIKAKVGGELLQLVQGVGVQGTLDASVFVRSHVSQLGGGTPAPAAVANTAPVGQSTQDKLDKLDALLGTGSAEDALDKLLKLLAGLEGASPAARAQRITHAQRVFDQRLANALPVAAGGSKLKVEEDNDVLKKLSAFEPVAAAMAGASTAEKQKRVTAMISIANGTVPLTPSGLVDADPAVVSERDAAQAERDAARAIVDDIKSNARPARRSGLMVVTMSAAKAPTKAKFSGKFTE